MTAKPHNDSLRASAIGAQARQGRQLALAQQVRDLHERVKRQDEAIATLVALREHYEAMLNIVDEINAAGIEPMAIKPLARDKSCNEAVAMAVLSDAHIFERVYASQVNGLNEYTPAAARASCEEFFRAVVKWTKIHRAGVAVPQLVLALLGDLITNMLHIDQVETNAGTPQEELLAALEIINGGIDFLLKEGGFDTITIVCCDGNHGRGTEKMRIKNRSKHSYEWLLYQILAKLYADERRVKFIVADGIHVYLPVFDKTVRFCHGDAIKYEGGVGGLTIPILKAIDKWNKAKRADLDVFGHWHTSINDTTFISNGSVLGYSEFSVARRLAFEPPAQTFALLDKKRWITSFNRIYVR